MLFADAACRGVRDCFVEQIHAVVSSCMNFMIGENYTLMRRV